MNPREISIEKLKASLEYVGTCAEQLGKITDLLSLTMYYKDSPEDREKYFYTAVELAQRCIEDDTIRVLYWKEIISTFLLYIRKMTPEQANDATHMQSARDHIPVASIVWNQK